MTRLTGFTHGTTSVPRRKSTLVSGSQERGKKAPKHSPKVIENTAYKWHTIENNKNSQKKRNTENKNARLMNVIAQS